MTPTLPREIDIALAEKLFGIVPTELRSGGRSDMYRDELHRLLSIPHFSTDPAASETVRLKLVEVGYSVDVEYRERCVVASVWQPCPMRLGEARESTSFLAVARAALASLEAK